VARAARIQAGALGPVLEDQLRRTATPWALPAELRVLHPGRLLATRSGGHYANGGTHIDDFVESMRYSPGGVSESWPAARLRRRPSRTGVPGFRGHPRGDHRGLVADPTPPEQRAQPPCCSPTSTTPCTCCAPSPSPAWCWQLPAARSRRGPVQRRRGRSHAVLVLGAESAGAPVSGHAGRGGRAGEGRRRVLEDRERGAVAPGGRRPCAGPACGTAWPGSARVVETFETACHLGWAGELCAKVRRRWRRGGRRCAGRPGVNCRVTHVYRTAGPYFTVLAAGRPGAQLAQWDRSNGRPARRWRGTGAHHPITTRPAGTTGRVTPARPELLAAALRAAKQSWTHRACSTRGS